LVDIDNFKSVNDRYGHGVGDRVIKLVASTLEDACAPQFVGRWGGEEFIVVMPSSDLAAVVKRLNQARATLADTEFKLRETDEPMGLISFSGGVALAVGAGDANAAALRQADKALYRAKAAGRNCILSA
ncbi:MAG TPA: GGDEF domain-containing protein, partial [Erythrobacter sp.]|nr:GGDEF domain-containing protein [Erythrobacter sp.]